MTTQEKIIGKVSQAKAIKQAMSLGMKSKAFKVMNSYYNELLNEAEDLNEREASNKNFYKNLEAINEVVDIEIILEY